MDAARQSEYHTLDDIYHLPDGQRAEFSGHTSGSNSQNSRCFRLNWDPGKPIYFYRSLLIYINIIYSRQPLELYFPPSSASKTSLPY